MCGQADVGRHFCNISALLSYSDRERHANDDDDDDDDTDNDNL